MKLVGNTLCSSEAMYVSATMVDRGPPIGNPFGKRYIFPWKAQTLSFKQSVNVDSREAILQSLPNKHRQFYFYSFNVSGYFCIRFLI